MNKEQLVRLQQKVNRLIRKSSQDSDQQKSQDFYSFNNQIKPSTQTQPDTVRKCIDLIKQNKQLKIALQKQRSKNDQLRKQLQKQKRQGKLHQIKEKESKTKNEQKLNLVQIQKVRKSVKLEASLQQSHKKNKILEQMLINERKKNNKLCIFINKNLPQMQNHIDKLTTKLDVKLQAHFSRLSDI